ncbi:hypothetical protein BV22DRAFT_1009661, partial [Leucogyrophana mollusca]
MLEFAIEYRRAIDELTAKKVDLRKYELDNNEWEIATHLRDVLGVLKDATLFFSRSTPNLATVIPAMDDINEVFTTHVVSEDVTLNPAIRAAVSIGKKTLDRYYSLTDSSQVYRIAMVLHPRHKLQYFRNAKWPNDWIETA